ncbi:arylamine N-acetyltransferase family protein [Streptomyces californicus]|uniref:arylamine N-acetyltransferase family protein n=1 Tax=Streptomyces californicus TaxID=67351 RepID=UPI0033E0D0A5
MTQGTYDDIPPSSWGHERVDLRVYARRVGLRDPGAGAPEERLRLLHRAHVAAIPFDNLDFVADVPVGLGPTEVLRKLSGPRGGCCHEHNLLFGCVLEHLGYRVDRIAARVRLGGEGPRPRTHMALHVRHGPHTWLCDVGFGVQGFLEPLPLHDGATSHQLGRTFRIRALSSPFWTVEMHQEDVWTALYHFTLEPQEPMDFVVAHHFLATHPRSMLRRAPLLHLTTPDTRLHVRGLDFLETRGGVQRTRRLTRTSLEADLARFGIRLPRERLSGLARRLFPPHSEGEETS